MEPFLRREHGPLGVRCDVRLALAQFGLIDPVDAHAQLALPSEVIQQDFPQLVVEGDLHYAVSAVLGINARHLEFLRQLGKHIEAAHRHVEVRLDGMVDVPDRPDDAGGSARRARRQPVLLKDRAGDAAVGELVGNRTSDNSTADYGNIGRSRHLSALRATMADSIRRRARVCKCLFPRLRETRRPKYRRL